MSAAWCEEVPTTGDAFLRNGWSQVTALRVRASHREGLATIEVRNSRGDVSNGLMSVGQPALVEMSKRVLAQAGCPVLFLEPLVVHLLLPALRACQAELGKTAQVLAIQGVPTEEIAAQAEHIGQVVAQIEAQVGTAQEPPAVAETEAPLFCSECAATLDLESTYCGSFCAEHLSAHLAECAVCRADWS